METIKQLWAHVQKHPKISIAIVVVAVVIYHLVK